MPVIQPGGGGAAVGASIIVQDEGVTIGTATVVNIVGSAATAAFSNGTATITVTGGTAVGSELAYVEFTADVSISATTEETANQIVSAGALVFDGSTRAKIEWWAPQVVTVSSVNTQVYLYDVTPSSTASIGLISRFLDDSASRSQPYGVRLMTPAAGTHTYSVRGTTGSGAATIGAGTGGAGVSLPGWIRVTTA